MNMRPKIAIIDPNTLSALGLKAILQNVMPIMTVDTFGSVSELQANDPDGYFHYFTAMAVVLENMPFFTERKRKTIVLTLSLDTTPLPISTLTAIYVPEASVTAYKAAPGWSVYQAIIQAAGSPTSVVTPNVNTKAIKHIVNGQLLIEKNGKFYNALGAEVK